MIWKLSGNQDLSKILHGMLLNIFNWKQIGPKKTWSSHSFRVIDSVVLPLLTGWCWSRWAGRTVTVMRVLASEERPSARNTKESWAASEPLCLYSRRDRLISLWSRLSSEEISNTDVKKHAELFKFSIIKINPHYWHSLGAKDAHWCLE